jgi:zinc D-Ala-D-Ala carboxypeptidase
LKLSKYLSLSEMTITENRRFIGKNNPPGDLVPRGRVLCTTILDPIRERWGPLVPSSGYRCEALNYAIGGSSTSQHMKFEACDFRIVGADLTEVFTWIWKESNLPFGQLILEGWTKNKPSWIHISLGEPYRPLRLSRQVKTMNAGKWKTLQAGPV